MIRAWKYESKKLSKKGRGEKKHASDSDECYGSGDCARNGSGSSWRRQDRAAPRKSAKTNRPRRFQRVSYRGETAHLEKQESNVNKEIRTDRKANGGNLTNKEKTQINRQQNGLSKEIYVDKHNDRHQQQ